MWQPSHQRQAFTLLELLLVLSLLIVIFALAAPRLTGVAMRNELSTAASQVRAAMMKTRHTAMRTGHVGLFLYRPETGFYAVLPAPFDPATESQLANVEAILASLDVASTPRNLTSATADSTSYAIRRLPRDVVFVLPGLDNTSSTTAGIATSTGGNSASANNSALGTTSNISQIAFQPDGTAMDCRIVLANAENDQLAIGVRGLTGLTQVSEMATPNAPFVAGRTPQ